MSIFSTCFVSLILLTLGQTEPPAEPPRMLLQERARFAIMRLPEGRFAFYDQNDPVDGPLTLADRHGRRVALLPGWKAEDLSAHEQRYRNQIVSR